MRSRKFFAGIFLFALAIPLKVIAGASGPSFDINIDIGDFCGQWRVLVQSNPSQPATDLSHCSKAPLAGYAAQSCTVKLDEGDYQFEIKANHRWPLEFTVDSKGGVSIWEPNRNIMARGGQQALTLNLMQAVVDKSGYFGAGGFEYVAWNNHPDKRCNTTENWAIIPVGSRFLLTGPNAWITSDRYKTLHSDNTNRVKANGAKLAYETARVLVYPEGNASGVPWTIWEAEGKNQGVPGTREVILPKDNLWELRAVNTDISGTQFDLTADCRAVPNVLDVQGYRFRLFPICQ